MIFNKIIWITKAIEKKSGVKLSRARRQIYQIVGLFSYFSIRMIITLDQSNWDNKLYRGPISPPEHYLWQRLGNDPPKIEYIQQNLVHTYARQRCRLDDRKNYFLNIGLGGMEDSSNELLTFNYRIGL